MSRVVEYKYNVKKYLFDKREVPYTQFIEMIYTIIEDTKKANKDKMTDEEMNHMVTEFSKGLTLWGSNRVVRKWLKYRQSANVENKQDILFQLEDMIFEMRKDVGCGHRLGKGDILSFFVKDVDKYK